MIQLNQIHLSSQTPIMLKLLKSQAPASVKVLLLTASACLEYASSKTNKTHAYKIWFSSRLQAYYICCFTSKRSPSTIKYPFL